MFSESAVKERKQPSSLLDVEASAERISRYWAALRKKAESGLAAGLPANAPLRSFLWSHLIYSNASRDWASREPLSRWFDLERREFSGMPMRDPKTFLDRLGVKVSPDFSYTTALAAGESLNIKLDESLRLIAREWPEMSREASQAILGVVWAQSDGFESGCDPKQFGVIVLNKDVFQQASPWEIATALIHETSHHALYVETTLDPLIPDDFMTPLYSTIRRETRPAIGVLHAAYAIARRGIWGLRLKRNGSEPGAVDEVRRIGRQYIHHYGTLLTELEKIRFSPRGAHIYQELRGLEPDFRELT